MTLYFSTFYPCISGLAEVFAQWLFFGCCLGKKAAPLRILPLFLLSCMGIFLPIPIFCKFLLLAVLLFLYGAFFCGRPASQSLLAALLAVELTQLCYGVFQPVLSFLAFLLYPAQPVLCGIFCMVAGDVLSLGLAFLCGNAILKYSARWDFPLLPAIIPLFMIFIISYGIAHFFYSNIVIIDPLHPALSLLHLPMLLVQLLGISSVFCILYTNQKASMLAVQNQIQARYTAETQERWNRTKALRHDMKNHITVARGLLEKGSISSASAYLAALDHAAAGLSSPFQTNRPACDVLLSEKAALAEQRGIAFHSVFQVPASCPVEDMDFCTLLANALDNAIHACEKLPPETEKFIRISSHIEGGFLLAAIENSFDGNPHVCPGTGLSNIRRTAKKYGGIIEVQTTDTVFHLSVLLSISQHPSYIPRQKH